MMLPQWLNKQCLAGICTVELHPVYLHCRAAKSCLLGIAHCTAAAAPLLAMLLQASEENITIEQFSGAMTNLVYRCGLQEGGKETQVGGQQQRQQQQKRQQRLHSIGSRIISSSCLELVYFLTSHMRGCALCWQAGQHKQQCTAHRLRCTVV
jgi:hypothetical protein